MSGKLTTARLSIGGEHFEVLVNPDAALDYKMGRAVALEKVLAADVVYVDASKGQRASSDKLRKFFQTDSPLRVAEEVLRKGELQLTSDQRRRLIEDKRRQIVAFIAKNFLDPRTGLPHPPTRVEQALNEAKVSIDSFKPAEEQAQAVIERLRLVLPLKAERVKLRVHVPAQFAPQSLGVLKSFGPLLQTEWGVDGGLTAVVEVAPGAQQPLLERLGSLTKGAVEAQVVK